MSFYFNIKMKVLNELRKSWPKAEQIFSMRVNVKITCSERIQSVHNTFKLDTLEGWKKKEKK